MVGVSANSNHEWCRACAQERDNALHFSAFFESGMDFHAVAAARLVCGVRGDQTAR